MSKKNKNDWVSCDIDFAFEEGLGDDHLYTKENKTPNLFIVKEPIEKNKKKNRNVKGKLLIFKTKKNN